MNILSLTKKPNKASITKIIRQKKIGKRSIYLYILDDQIGSTLIHMRESKYDQQYDVNTPNSCDRSCFSDNEVMNTDQKYDNFRSVIC